MGATYGRISMRIHPDVRLLPGESGLKRE